VPSFTRSSRYRLATLLAAAIGAAVSGQSRAADIAAAPPASPAPATAPTQQELLEKINALQSQVTELKNQQAASATVEQKLETQRAVDAAVAQVQADAQRHSQLFDLSDGNAIVARHTDSGFKFRSVDGNYSINPWAQFMFRRAVSRSAG
jgi:hypothetical protein